MGERGCGRRGERRHGTRADVRASHFGHVLRAWSLYCVRWRHRAAAAVYEATQGHGGPVGFGLGRTSRLRICNGTRVVRPLARGRDLRRALARGQTLWWARFTEPFAAGTPTMRKTPGSCSRAQSSCVAGALAPSSVADVPRRRSTGRTRPGCRLRSCTATRTTWCCTSTATCCILGWYVKPRRCARPHRCKKHAQREVVDQHLRGVADSVRAPRSASFSLTRHRST